MSPATLMEVVEIDSQIISKMSRLSEAGEDGRVTKGSGIRGDRMMTGDVQQGSNGSNMMW